MSLKGLCSRREADRLISDGQVLVDGQVISELGSKVSPQVEISLKKQGKKTLDLKVSLMIHKPVGYVSSQPENDYKAAVELVGSESQADPKNLAFKRSHLKGLAPAGRLDIDSKGLLILTSDGVLAKAIINQNSNVEKEYIVWVKGDITDNRLNKLRHGIVLDEKKLKPAIVEKKAEGRLKFILKEGRKRQIRRMCEAVGLKVTSLKRIRIGTLKLGNLKEGEWRFLSRKEISDLKNIGQSIVE